MYYSSDGMNWTDATCDGEQCDINQRAVAYNERSGIFFSSGHLLKHYYSFDGKNWTSIALPGDLGSHTTQVNKIIPLNEGFLKIGEGGQLTILIRVNATHE